MILRALRVLFVVVVSVGAFAPTGSAWQSNTESAGPIESVTSDSVRAWMQQAEAGEGLSDAQKTLLKGLYQKALNDVQRAEDARRRAESFRQRTGSAPQDTADAQAELEKWTAQPAHPLGLGDDPTVEVIEQALARAESTLSQLESERAGIENESKARDDRRTQSPALRESESARLEEATGKLAGGAPAVAPLDAAFAAWVQWSAQRIAAEAELASLDAELPSYDARSRLLRLRLDLAHLKVDRQSDLVERLRATLQEARARAAKEEEVRAKAAAERVEEIPLLTDLARGNLEIVTLRTDSEGLVARIDRATRRSAELKQKLSESAERFEQARRYIETVGLSDELVRVLQQPTESRTAVREHQRAISSRESELAGLGLKRIELESQRRQYRDPTGLARTKFAELVQDTDETGLDELRRRGVERQLEELIVARRDAIDDTIDDIGLLTRLYLDLNESERRLVQLNAEYTEFVDARVIWLRDVELLRLADLRSALGRAKALPIEERPFETTRALVGDMVRSWPAWFGAILLALAMLHYRRKARAAFQTVDLDAVGFANAARPIFYGCVEALLATLPVLLAFSFVAARCSSISHENDPARAVAASLRAGMVPTTVLYLLMRLMRRDGVFERHLGWLPQALTRVRSLTRGYIFFVVPLVCIYYYFVARPTLEPSEPLSRMCFIAAMIGTAVYGFTMARPITVALEHKYRSDPGQVKRRKFALVALVAWGPVVIAALSAYGYHTTAQRLVERLFPTTVVIAAVMIAVQLFDSWFYIARRAEAVARLRKRREELLASAKSDAKGEKREGGEVPSEAPNLEVNEVDLKKLNAQARELVRGTAAVFFVVLIWLIWVDMLPALRVFDGFTLWEVKTTVGGEEVARGIRIIDLFSASIALLLTWMVARNLPGLVEAAILSKLPFDAGARYAVVTILRYVITLAGIAVVFDKLGVGWEDFQWLVAAISVGLGFGLQEIFGNFVSGIILLFERPLRVGDVVTVSGVSGVVTKIRMRATTILDGDNKEHIIPNKNMITGAVVNWVLTSQTIRVQVSVGVAYGTDTRKVEQLLLAIGKSHAEVVDDPAPSVIFQSFGPSSLDFVLNVFVKSPAHAGRVRTELNRAIDEAFKRQGIEIPYPTQQVIEKKL